MLYAVGGEAGSQGATNSMERFNLDDPDAGWELSMAMPSERLYHSVGVVNEEMYVVAGRGDKHDSHTGCSGVHCNLDTVLRYDALLGEWDDMAPMNNARQYQGAAGDDEADLLQPNHLGHLVAIQRHGLCLFVLSFDSCKLKP